MCALCQEVLRGIPSPFASPNPLPPARMPVMLLWCWTQFPAAPPKDFCWKHCRAKLALWVLAFLVMFSAFLKSWAPDVLRPWGESQIYRNWRKVWKSESYSFKILSKSTHPSDPVSGLSSQSSDFCLTVFGWLGVASCVPIAAALGLFRRIWV